MIEKQELGEFYKELRLAKKLKQSDVACAGLTASQLSKFDMLQKDYFWSVKDIKSKV